MEFTIHWREDMKTIDTHILTEKNTQQKPARPPEETPWEWPLTPVDLKTRTRRGWRWKSGERPLVAAGRLSGVELGQGALRNPFQHLLGEDSQQLPANVKSFIHRPVVVGAYRETGGRWTPETFSADTHHSHHWIQRPGAASARHLSK